MALFPPFSVRHRDPSIDAVSDFAQGAGWTNPHWGHGHKIASVMYLDGEVVAEEAAEEGAESETYQCLVRKVIDAALPHGYVDRAGSSLDSLHLVCQFLP